MRIYIAIALALSAGACASITRGTTEMLQFESNPPDAQVRTSTGYTCTTPCTMQSNRKDEFIVTISKAGYHSAEVPVVTQVSTNGAIGFAGNAIIGGVVGMVADASTGATLDHYPNPIAVTLQPVKNGEARRVIKIVPKPKEAASGTATPPG